MRSLRVSISALLAGIALVAVALAALAHPSPLWANTLFSLALAILTLAILRAIYARGARRASWVGFATCGWAYFLTALGPDPISDLRSSLVTTAILEIVYPHTFREETPVVLQVPMTGRAAAQMVRPARTSGGGATVFLAGAFATRAPSPTTWETWTAADRVIGGGQSTPTMFGRIGHSIFCLLCGLMGGLVTRRFRGSPGPVET